MSLRPVRTVCGLILLSQLAACGDAKHAIPPHHDDHPVNVGDGDVTKGDGDNTGGDGDKSGGDGDATGKDAGPGHMDADAGPAASDDAGPTPDNGGPGQDGGPVVDPGPGPDAGPVVGGPAGDGGPGNEPGPDAGPGASDAGPPPAALRITSPAKFWTTDNAPKCTEANFGDLEHDTMTVGSDSKVYEVGILRVCARSKFGFEPTAYNVGPRGQADFFGTPVRTSWGGVVNFFEHGLYKQSLGVTLLEGDDHFLSITCAYGGEAQQQLHVSRADGPATISCPWTSDDDSTGAWKAYGSLAITVDHDALSAVFHPADGSADVPVTLFAM